MDRFSGRGQIEFGIELKNEPAFYGPGDSVKGRVIIYNRIWPAISVEVLVLCEEDIAVDSNNRQRRMTIVGETVDGMSEPISQRGSAANSLSGPGYFEFDLRIPDDPHAKSMLPSFEVTGSGNGSGSAIRWYVEARLTHKNRVVECQEGIVFVPTKPISSSISQRVARQNTEIVIYEKKGRALNSPVSVLLHFPAEGLRQYPLTTSLGLTLLLTHPHLVTVEGVQVQLVAAACLKIDDLFSEECETEDLQDVIGLNAQADGDVLDLTPYLTNTVVQDHCPSFEGRWLSMEHRLKVTVALKPKYGNELQYIVVEPIVPVLPPRTCSDVVDAPPMYSPVSPVSGTQPPFEISRYVKLGTQG